MKIIFSSIFIFFFLSANAQVRKKVVIDLKTSKPVPFATIKVLNKPQGVIASETGEFDLSIDDADSILVTCIGYQSIKILGKNISATIYLEPKTTTLKEVSIHSKRVLRTLILGYDTSQVKSDLSWGPGTKTEFAQRMNLPDTNRTYRLNRVFIRVKKHGCYGPLQLHIYATDSLTGMPGEALFSKTVYLDKSLVKKSKAAINMIENNLVWSGDQSFFIGFSWLPVAGEQQCLTTIYFLKSKNYTTFIRTIMSENYNWHPFQGGKDEMGNPSPVSTFFSVEVDELD